MDALFTKVIKAGKTTYFVDVKEAKNNSKFIQIVESSPAPAGSEKKFSRRSVTIFDNAAEQIRDTFAEATALLKK